MNRDSLIPLSFIVELINPPCNYPRKVKIALFQELSELYTDSNEISSTATVFSTFDKKIVKQKN